MEGRRADHDADGIALVFDVDDGAIDADGLEVPVDGKEVGDRLANRGIGVAVAP